MEQHELKSKELYELAPFTISSLDKHFDLNYHKFDFNSEYFGLQHHTSIERAISIITTTVMYGLDGNQAAHFMPLKLQPIGAAKNSTILYFRWYGKQINTGAADIVKANILHHVCSFDSQIKITGEGYWESRLYPKTDEGLFLVALASSNNPDNILLFDEKIKISITTKQNFQREWIFEE